MDTEGLLRSALNFRLHLEIPSGSKNARKGPFPKFPKGGSYISAAQRWSTGGRKRDYQTQAWASVRSQSWWAMKVCDLRTQEANQGDVCTHAHEHACSLSHTLTHTFVW